MPDSELGVAKAKGRSPTPRRAFILSLPGAVPAMIYGKSNDYALEIIVPGIAAAFCALSAERSEGFSRCGTPDAAGIAARLPRQIPKLSECVFSS